MTGQGTRGGDHSCLSLQAFRSPPTTTHIQKPANNKKPFLLKFPASSSGCASQKRVSHILMKNYICMLLHQEDAALSRCFKVIPLEFCFSSEIPCVPPPPGCKISGNLTFKAPPVGQCFSVDLSRAEVPALYWVCRRWQRRLPRGFQCLQNQTASRGVSGLRSNDLFQLKKIVFSALSLSLTLRCRNNSLNIKLSHLILTWSKLKASKSRDSQGNVTSLPGRWTPALG